jgi:hypothetical protein
VPKYVQRNQHVYKEINISGKEMICSLVLKSSLFIGCKDGTLIEIDLNSLKFIREM